jgi:pilus assembly protein CpaE
MEKMKVIVFEIYPKLGKTLVDLLKSIPFVECIENSINNTVEAFRLIHSEQPDVVFLGNDFPGMAGYQFTQTIRKEAAPTQVIMIAEVASTEMVRQAMRSGACDFISYRKLTTEELTLALEQAKQLANEERKTTGAHFERIEPAIHPAPQPTEEHRSKVVSVYSPKGGAGVSTITANLACILAAENLRVLVIDGDFLFGDMEILLNQRGNNSIKDLTRFTYNLEDDVIKSVIIQGNVDLLAAPSKAEEAAEITGPIFEVILQGLAKLGYDYILINTNSYLSDPTLVALDKSDTILLIGNQEIACVRSLSKFLSLAMTIGVHPENILLVMNKYENNSALSEDMITKRLEMKISHKVPQDYDTVIRANNLGIPFVNGNKELPVSQSIVGLARLLKKENKTEISGIGRIFQNVKKSLSRKPKGK